MKFYLVPRNYYNSNRATIKGIFMADCIYKYVEKRKIESLYIQIDNSYYKGITDDMKFFLCIRKNSNFCTMWPHRINFNVPWNIAKNLTQIKLINKKTGGKKIFKLDTTAAMNKPYEGLTICVPVLYYYNNWLQMFLFLEKWREQENAKVVIYYKSLSLDVYNLLKYYEKIKLVTLLPAPDIEKTKNIRLRSPTSFFISHLYFDDCMYGRNIKYAAVMDVDEYFHFFNSNKTILDYIKEYSILYPKKTFFNFESMYMSYNNHKVDDSFKFGTTVSLLKDNINLKGKSITLIDKNDYIGYHYPLDRKNIIGKNYSKNFNFGHGYRFPKNKAILLHARPNYIFQKFKNSMNVVILNESQRLTLHNNYQLLKKDINFNYPLVYKNIITNHLDKCIKEEEKKLFKNGVCIKNFDYCFKKLEKLDNWIYAENDKDKYYNLIEFK
ncbi:Domain of unknown function DUF23 domain-containing protein [Strongyloides ratti]|uniref:Glycosyltransferase family 92 protein n=1 Tax=Strongyloides ratti TaxID=34506 RepID=A0A090LJE0_STRRB|nr:Domain of unknown function DUF23 domain-containing protein [Strongyloides ratti]CEF69952.1 Domain of unknown function DUF23 domain-containing protein [Strongyloides ratti]